MVQTCRYEFPNLLSPYPPSGFEQGWFPSALYPRQTAQILPSPYLHTADIWARRNLTHDASGINLYMLAPELLDASRNSLLWFDIYLPCFPNIRSYFLLHR